LRRILRTTAACLLLGSALLFGQAAWMRAKAAVASVLIARSLEATLRDGRPRPPWSWADFHPVARLRVPRLGISRPVLSGATGATLAFGLGRVHGGPETFVGHRDTWASFLRDVREGDAVLVEDSTGTRRYRVRQMRVVPPDDRSVLEEGGGGLTLVTCWPFGGFVRSRQRLVITCDASTG
jgi:sortase A